MGAEPQRRWTAEEYLAHERESEVRSELIDGEVVAMAGASREHNLISLNVAVALHGQLAERGCEEYVSDMRVHVPASSFYTYPDVVVVCGEPIFADDRRDTLVNPVLIVEVLSPSTEAYDRGQKFAYYRDLETLTTYLLITASEPRLERFVRQGDGDWLLTEVTELDASLELPGTGARLALADVYRRVPGIS